jgi:hypothetical protein
MTRKSVVLLFACYFLAALAFAAFELMHERHAVLDPTAPVSVSSVLRRAVWYYLLCGILPMIGWGGAGFRLQNAYFPFFGWAIVLVGFGFLKLVYGN